MSKKTIVICIIVFLLLIGLLVVFKKMGDDTVTGKVNILIKVKDYGDIKAELDADAAPITVNNFVKLVKDHFYDGLTFHRIIDDFMIQGGDGITQGRVANTIKGEFSSNGVENDIKHVRGTISMARSSIKDSASSQFFIMTADKSHLDGEYAAFGHVTEGMEVVDKITKEVAPKAYNSNGGINKEDQPIIETIILVD